MNAYAAKPKRGKQHGMAHIKDINFDNHPEGRITDERINGISISTHSSQGT